MKFMGRKWFAEVLIFGSIHRHFSILKTYFQLRDWRIAVFKARMRRQFYAYIASFLPFFGLYSGIARAQPSEPYGYQLKSNPPLASSLQPSDDITGTFSSPNFKVTITGVDKSCPLGIFLSLDVDSITTDASVDAYNAWGVLFDQINPAVRSVCNDDGTELNDAEKGVITSKIVDSNVCAYQDARALSVADFPRAGFYVNQQINNINQVNNIIQFAQKRQEAGNQTQHLVSNTIGVGGVFAKNFFGVLKVGGNPKKTLAVTVATSAIAIESYLNKIEKTSDTTNDFVADYASELYADSVKAKYNSAFGDAEFANLPSYNCQVYRAQ